MRGYCCRYIVIVFAVVIFVVVVVVVVYVSTYVVHGLVLGTCHVYASRGCKKNPGRTPWKKKKNKGKRRKEPRKCNMR